MAGLHAARYAGAVSAPRPTLNPARALAVRVLSRVLAGEAFAAPLLDEALSESRLEARDAGLATHIVYGTLRHLLTLQLALAPLITGDTPPRVQTLLLAGTFEKLILGTPPHAAVSEYVSLARRDFGRLSGLVNAVLRRVEKPEATPESTYAMPGWLIETFRDAYGRDTEAVLLDLLEPQPLWLWLTGDGVREMEAEGSNVKGGYGAVYRVNLTRPLRETKAFQAGHAQPINPSSRACVQALGGLQGAPVLDLAGGGGVKAALLAAGGAEVTSVDLDARKHRAAAANLARLGVSASFVEADLSQPTTLRPSPMVLLDAPCTGTGTLRAHPEIKLRLKPESVDDLAALQRRMLDTAAGLTMPGGVLVYSVCSVTHAEGPGVLGEFLKAHRDFRPEPFPELDVITIPAGQGRRTIPTGGLDGFFIARMRRAL